MLDYLKKRPIIIAAVCCSATAVCGYYSKYMLGLILTALIPAFVRALLYKKLKSVLILAMVIFVGFSCGKALLQISRAGNFENKSLSCEFVVLEKTYDGEDFSLSNIEICKDGALSSSTKISLRHSKGEFEMGDLVLGTVTIEEADESFETYGYSSGVYIFGTLEKGEKVGENLVVGIIDDLRKYIKNSLFQNMSKDSAITVSALVFGDRSGFSDEYYGNVKASGVAHVMVVSGMHLSIIVTLLLKLIERLFYSPVLKATVMLFVVILICGVCGFTMSILRAGITYVIMAVGLLLKREYSAENALAFAVVLILWDTPFAIMNVGLLLSVLSTFGILAVALPICNFLKHLRFKGHKLKGFDSAILSVSALILTMPVCIAAFGEISVVAVITNLLIDMPVTACLCISVVALVLKPIIPFVGALLLSLADYITRYVNAVINWFGQMKLATVDTPPWTSIFAVFLIFAVFCLLAACKKRIDVLKSSKIYEKSKTERGRSFKWRLWLKKR